jgi:DNA-binding MarR family transcriptional regulator
VTAAGPSERGGQADLTRAPEQANEAAGSVAAILLPAQTGQRSLDWRVAFRNALALEQGHSATPLTHREAHALYVLADRADATRGLVQPHRPSRFGTLADALGVDQQGARRTLKALQSKGWLEVHQHAKQGATRRVDQLMVPAAVLDAAKAVAAPRGQKTPPYVVGGELSTDGPKTPPYVVAVTDGSDPEVIHRRAEMAPLCAGQNSPPIETKETLLASSGEQVDKLTEDTPDHPAAFRRSQREKFRTLAADALSKSPIGNPTDDEWTVLVNMVDTADREGQKQSHTTPRAPRLQPDPYDPRHTLCPSCSFLKTAHALGCSERLRA